MASIARWFFISALIYGVLGMLLGLHMAMTQNHGQMPTHAHIMVIGWLSFAVFGFFYHLFGERVSRVLSGIHCVLAELSLLGIVIGLLLVYGGSPEYEPIAAISSLVYAGSFVLFAIVAWPAVRLR